MKANDVTRYDIEDCRRKPDRIIAYKTAFCELIGSCEECDKRIRFGCKLICLIEKQQTKRILKRYPKQ